MKHCVVLFVVSLWLLTACRSSDKQPQAETAHIDGATSGTPGDSSGTTVAVGTPAAIGTLVDSLFPGYELVTQFPGDLNGDGRGDYVLLLQRACDSSDAIPEANCRTLCLLTADEGGRLSVAARNAQLVGCSDCGGAGVGDPFQNVVIKGDYFSVEQLFGSCEKTEWVHTFRYDRSSRSWLLHREGRVDYNCQQEDKSKTTTKTKKDFGTVRFEDYNADL